MQIKKIEAYEIIDSRGNPTVECEVTLANGIKAHAAVPSGASTGEREALELRDGGSRYHGKGVLKAVENVNKIIAPKIVGMEVENQKSIDRTMMRKTRANLCTPHLARATPYLCLCAILLTAARMLAAMWIFKNI